MTYLRYLKRLVFCFCIFGSSGYLSAGSIINQSWDGADSCSKIARFLSNSTSALLAPLGLTREIVPEEFTPEAQFLVTETAFGSVIGHTRIVVSLKDGNLRRHPDIVRAEELVILVRLGIQENRIDSESGLKLIKDLESGLRKAVNAVNKAVTTPPNGAVKYSVYEHGSNFASSETVVDPLVVIEATGIGKVVQRTKVELEKKFGDEFTNFERLANQVNRTYARIRPMSFRRSIGVVKEHLDPLSITSRLSDSVMKDMEFMQKQMQDGKVSTEELVAAMDAFALAVEGSVVKYNHEKNDLETRYVNQYGRRPEMQGYVNGVLKERKGNLFSEVYHFADTLSFRRDVLMYGLDAAKAKKAEIWKMIGEGMKDVGPMLYAKWREPDR